jgi:hypothetical protein
MLEENKFLPVDSIELYGDSIGRCTLYDTSYANESEEQRQYTVATISSLAYGNEEAKHPDKLYKKLQQLGHESLAEFIRPCFTGYDINSSIRNKSNDILWYERQIPSQLTYHKENIACFRIKVPIFVARQFMRHRSFSYLEMSRRYTKGSKVPFEFWFPNEFSKEYKSIYVTNWNIDYDRISKNYETQVAARFLPQTIYTEFYVMGEADGLSNFFKLRLDSHSQAEIRECAKAMLELLVRHQPELAKKVTP